MLRVANPTNPLDLIGATRDIVEGTLVDWYGEYAAAPEIGRPLYLATQPKVRWDFCTSIVEFIFDRGLDGWEVQTTNAYYLVHKLNMDKAH